MNTSPEPPTDSGRAHDSNGGARTDNIVAKAHGAPNKGQPTDAAEPRVEMAHYFSTEPTVPSALRKITVALPDGLFSLTTDRGVFSYGELDPGTALLLREAPPPAIDGDILDLGCGYGVVSVVWATREPHRRVWAVDVNERALALTRENAASAGVSVTAHKPDEIPSETRFAAIYSNPPIKVGKKVLQQMLESWLHRLLPGGVAYLVVSKHLGSDSLARWLADAGHDVQRLATKRGYRILAVRPSLTNGSAT